MKSKAVCKDCQAKDSAVKCLSQGQNNVSSFQTATVSIAFGIPTGIRNYTRGGKNFSNTSRIQ